MIDKPVLSIQTISFWTLFVHMKLVHRTVPVKVSKLTWENQQAKHRSSFAAVVQMFVAAIKQMSCLKCCRVKGPSSESSAQATLTPPYQTRSNLDQRQLTLYSD